MHDKMIRMNQNLPLLTAWLLLATVLVATAAEPISLFDGKTLDGWETVERDAQFWRVQDGVIMADSLGKKMPRNTFLFSKAQYDHFEFRCKFRLTGQPKTGLVNSGIQFRTAKHGNGSAKGYQADIGEPKWWGCLYDEHRRGLIARSDISKLKGTLQPFGWNEYLIRAKGPVITLFINGIQTIEYTEQDATIPDKGHFALQLHSGGICRIESKDITLTPLSYDGPKVAPKPIKTASLNKGEVMFADFESGTYDGWTVTGTAFGKTPHLIRDTPSYQGNLQASGKYCVNSHASAIGDLGARDRATGTLTSKPFKVSHRYIRFLIGGGAHANQTCMNLIIGSEVRATATGANNNAMNETVFDVSTYKGQVARLQIVDTVPGGWGNIGVDDIIFTDTKPKLKKPAKPPKPAAKKPDKKTQSGRTRAWSPEEQLRGFRVPEGFVVELVASEKDGVINPIDLTFDDAGRLWTNTAEMYPLDPDPGASWGQTLRYMDNPDLQMAHPNFRKVKDMYEGKARGDDKLLIIADATAKTPTKPAVWADGLAIPQSILPYKNGAFVAHGSEMMYLEDTDNDGKADKRTSVLSGFGYTDTHTMAHLLVRAPGGWVHYAHGALNKGNVLTVKTGEYDRVDYAKTGRFSLDGTQHDLVVAGLNNIWGHTLRANGQWYGSEANDGGNSVTPMEPGTAYNGIGKAKLRDYQPMQPAPNGFRVGGTGLSGLIFSDDAAGGVPAAWQGVAFLANPITSRINAVRIVRNPNGSVSSEQLPDFVESQDDWFRPVNVVFGPDGCLYIADFYNKIISHNEVPRTHPERDKSHGRIWRIRYTGATAAKVVDMTKLPTAELPAQLKSPILWAKRAAWHQMVDRNAAELVPALAAICRDAAQDEATRILALWSLEGLKHYNATLMKDLLASPQPNLRREAVRALANLPVSPPELATFLKPFVQEKNVLVRSQVLRTLDDYGKTNPALIDLAVSFCLPDLKSGNLGGGYERKFERYLARRALERYPIALGNYLDSDLANAQPESHRTWAAQALSDKAREAAFLAQWPSMKQKPLDDASFMIVCSMLRSPQIHAAVKPVFEADGSAYLIDLALAKQSEVLSPQLSALLSSACARLLGSADATNVARGAVAADKLRIPGQAAVLAGRLGKGDLVADSATAVVNVLARAPKAHAATLTQALSAETLPNPARVTAVAALATVDSTAASKHAADLAKTFSDTDKADLINRLSATATGSIIVATLLDQGVLAESAIDLHTALRMQSKAGKNGRIAALVDAKQAAAAAAKKAFSAKLERFVHVAEQQGGDPAKGAPLFTALCLSCHAVGTTGAGFAPPLDGSAHRDNEGLLTAILDPDAAIEGSYTLYQISKTDGSLLQGYLEKEDERGSTLRFLGGGSLFVPKNEIASGGFLPGRSVMPAGLIDNLPEAVLADLLAYIRTLK